MRKYCRYCRTETSHRKLSKIKDGIDAWFAISTMGMSLVMENQEVECNRCGTKSDKD